MLETEKDIVKLHKIQFFSYISPAITFFKE